MDKINKKYIIYGLILMLLISIGVSVAYFSARIVGKGNKVTVQSGGISIIFTDTTEIAEENIGLDWSTSKTFTVENQSSNTYFYSINIKDLINTLETEGYLQYKITSSNGYNMTEYKSIPKSEEARNQPLIGNIAIPAGVIQEYTVEFRYVNDPGVNQSGDMGKTFSGILHIEESEPNKLYEQILADKTTRPGGNRPNLGQPGTNGIYTTSNTKTLYQTTKTENGNPSYYFAGNAQDNWVLFAGNYWRIIRINEDNSVRLLYVGPDKNTTEGYINGSTTYNSTSNNPRYVGYMYGSSTGSLANDRGNNTNSTIKGVIDSWYSTNITNKTDGSNAYDSYVSRTAIYCNDRSIGEGTYSTSSTFYFGARTRLITNKAPSYKCGQNASTGLFESSQAVADKFSGSTTGGGNVQLTYPVALMTADEVAFAGGAYGTISAAWYYYNASGTSVTGDKYWWTSSPCYFGGGNARVFTVYGSSTPGYLGTDWAYETRGVRPVLSLKSCVKWSGGDGTNDNPYKVSTGSTCTTDLN